MKKFMSLFLTLAMLVTCFGTNIAFAGEPGPSADPSVSVTGQYADNGYYFLRIKFQNAPSRLDSLELGLEEDDMYKLDRFDQFSYCDVYNKMKSEDGAKTIYVCLSKSEGDTLYYQAEGGGDVISGSVSVPALKKAKNDLDWTGYSDYKVGPDTEKIEMMLQKNLSEADTITEASDVLEKYNALKDNTVAFNSGHGMPYRYPAVVLYESLAGNFDGDIGDFEGEMLKTLFFTVFNDSLYFGEPLSDTMDLLEKYNLKGAGQEDFDSLSGDEKLAAAAALRLYNGYNTEERDEIGPFITLDGFYTMYDAVLNSVKSADIAKLKGFSDGTTAVNVDDSKQIDFKAASDDEMVIFDSTNAERLRAGDGYKTADGVIYGIQDGWTKIVCVKVSTAEGSQGKVLSYDVLPLQAVDPNLPVAYSYRQEAGKVDMMMVVFPKPMDVTPVPADGTAGDGSGIWSLDKLAASLKVGKTSVDPASGQVKWITNQIAKVTFPATDIKAGETITLDFIDSVKLKEEDLLNGGQLTLGDRLLVTAPTVADNIGPVGKIVARTGSWDKLEVIFNELIPDELQTAVPSEALKKITLYAEDGSALKEFTAADLKNLTWSQRDGRDVMTIHFSSDYTVGKTDYFKIDYTGFIKDYSGNAIDSRSKAMPIGGGMNEPFRSFTLGKGTMEILDGIREAAGGKTPKIAVTSSSDIGYQSCMDYFMSVKLQAAYGFALMGMEPVMGGITVDTYKNSTIIAQTVKSFEDCTGMFGPGGDQAMNTRSYLKDDASDTEQMRGLRQIYYSGGIVSGSSAGDHSLSNPMLNGGESSEAIRYNRIEFSSADDWEAVPSDSVPLITPGFGFLKDYGLTDSHVNTRGRLGRIIVALKHIPEDAAASGVSGIEVTPGIEKGIGIGVDEDTALLVIGNTGRVLGTSGVMLSDISGANFPDTEMFTATNVRLSYLTSGDTYNFDTKAVTSSKPAAVETAGTLSPSEDIFPTSLEDSAKSGPEALIRDLIRSKASSNYGVDYNNEDIVLTFKKDANTKGYYASDDAFTVNGLKLDITVKGSDPGDQGGKGGKKRGDSTNTPTTPPTNGPVSAGINSFADVKEADWFYDAVKYVQEKGLMNGVGDTAFGPHGTTTRGMIVTILYRLEGTPAAGTNGFTDVAAGKYYADAAAWAAANQIVSGYGGGKFGPEDPITREQLAMILMNYARIKGYDVSARADLSAFSDAASVSGYAKDAMAWANASGLIKGDGGKLIPNGNAERAQVAVILQRFMESIAK